MNKDVVNAIKKSIESGRNEPVSEQIANAVFGTDLQNEDFIQTKEQDKVQDVQNQQEIAQDCGCDECEKQSDENPKEYNLGKFKNPEELMRAYGELEKEFTRRCQRIKELERGAHKGEMSEEQWKEAVDKFFEKTPSAKPFAREIASKIMQEPELKKDENCLNAALTRVLLDKFRPPEQLMPDGHFLTDYVLCSDKVKSAVIADYLQSLRMGQPPKTMADGGLACVAQGRKPRTVEEAGIMFLKNNE